MDIADIMAMMGMHKKEYGVGLDIGSSTLKSVQFAEKEGGTNMARADLKDILPSADEAGWVREAASSMRQLLHGIDLNKSRITAAVNCAETAIKSITVPYMPKGELRRGIMMEAKNYFPFPIENSILDYEILADVVEKGIRKYRVIVAVSPEATIRRQLSVLEGVGIRPSALVPSAYALCKQVGRSSAADSKTACLIDIGELHTELVIVKGANLIFSRKIPVAGSDFTKAMTGTLVSDRGKTQLSMEEAEEIKREVGMPSGSNEKMIRDKVSSVQLFSMLRAPAEQLVNEIGRCFDYCREETGGEKVETVSLYGGGASLGGLAGFLQAELGIEVRLGGLPDGIIPGKSATASIKDTAHRIELAIGAALTAPGGINLLPPEIKDQTKIAVKKGTILAVITAAILLLALFYMGLKIRVESLQKRLAADTAEYSTLQPQFRKAEALMLANKVLADEPRWGDVFKELSNLIPDDIHLESMKMEKGIITMTGIAASSDADRTVLNFILNLEKGIFNNVKLIRSKDIEGEEKTEFEIRCWIDYENS